VAQSPRKPCSKDRGQPSKGPVPLEFYDGKVRRTLHMPNALRHRFVLSSALAIPAQVPDSRAGGNPCGRSAPSLHTTGM